MYKHFIYFIMLSLIIIEAKSYSTNYITHFQTYLLYNNKRIIRCLRMLKKGNNCVNRAVGSFKPSIMPICYIY
jgi:hypothetical protein